MYLGFMAERAARKIALPPDLADFVASRVSSGRYASEGEVLREGLRLLEERELAHEASEKSLRSSIDLGLKQALRGELLDEKDVFESLERRISNHRA